MTIYEKVQQAIDGELDALIVYAELKREIKELTELVPSIEELAFVEAEKYEKTFQLKDFIFERRGGGVTYDYSNIPEWKKKKEELSMIENIAKHAYSSYCKNIQTANEFGEEIILPAVKGGKDSLVVKFKK